MLTKKDIDFLKSELTDELKDIFVTKTEFNDFKDQVFTSFDEVMGELKTIREEIVFIGHRVSDHTDRIEKLEKLHPHSPLA